MTDRELLELAAKAAGVNGRYYEFAGEFGLINDDPDCEFWNPLTSNGDALRLSADLDIFGNPSYWHWLSIARLSGSTDKYANVRYAITRAAAEIGRTMK